MKLNVTQSVKEYDGTDIKDPATQKPAALRLFLVNALNSNPEPGQPPLTAEKKERIYRISTKLWAGNEVDLTADERAFIVERVGEAFGPLLYGRVSDLVMGDEPSVPLPDPADKKKK